VKAGAGKSPIILHGGERDAKNLSYFFICPTAKITQLDDLSLRRIFLRQFVERFIYRQQFFIGLWCHQINLFNIDSLESAAMPLPHPSTGAFDQDAAHGLRRGGKKVSAVLKVRSL